MTTKRNPGGWAPESTPLAEHLIENNENTLNAYKAKPNLVLEHANIEMATYEGGYSRRELYELIQNGADALLGHDDGKIRIVLSENALYCANEGAPIDESGLESLLSSHISMKRGQEIGRFGLGFKSVLGVTDSPEFFSKSVSFAFSSEWSEERILEAVPDLTSQNPNKLTPTLRLAEPLDAKAAGIKDPILSDLMTWATTVVKLPLNRPGAHYLPEDLGNFPEAFLLFSPHVSELILDNQRGNSARRIRVKPSKRDKSRMRLLQDTEAPGTQLFDTQKDEEWLLLSNPGYKPSEKARNDAGQLSKRDEVTIHWAVPLTGKQKTAEGQFWAFFPTEYRTTLSGIINAPWKTNEDRANLLKGTFNEELLYALSDLVTDNLHKLVSDEDLGAHIDLLPGRGREERNWADGVVTARVYALAAEKPSLPNQKGTLKHPGDIKLFPKDLPDEALKEWCSYPNRPAEWCHSDVSTRERMPRAIRLVEQSGGGEPARIESWLESLAESGGPRASIAAIKAAAAALPPEGPKEYEKSIMGAAFILDSNKQLVDPDPSTLFLPSGYRLTGAGSEFIHQKLLADTDTLSALEKLGIQRADASGDLRAMLEEAPDENGDWVGIWELSRNIDLGERVNIFQHAIDSHLSVYVRTLDGEFKVLPEIFLPGPIVSHDGSRDTELTVNLDTHDSDKQTLSLLNVVTEPKLGSLEMENWYRKYKSSMIREYLQKEEFPDAKPKKQSLGFFKKDRDLVRPVGPLPKLSPDGAVALTSKVLELLPDKEDWILKHGTIKTYPTRKCPRPELWWLKQHGYVGTSTGPRPVAESVSPALSEWSEFLPVANCSEDNASRLSLPKELTDIPETQVQSHLAELCKTDAPETETPIGSFYAQLADFLPTPEKIVCRGPDGPMTAHPNEVSAVVGESQLSLLTNAGDPALLVLNAGEIDRLVEHWGLQAGKVQTQVVSVPSSMSVEVRDWYLEMGAILDDEHKGLKLQPCESLELVTLSNDGKLVDKKTKHQEDATVYFVKEEVDDDELLQYLSKCFDLQLKPDDITGFIKNRQANKRAKRETTVRKEPSLAKKLLKLGLEESLRKHLPVSLLETIKADGEEIKPIELAELALATHGVRILEEFKEELMQPDFSVPVQWVGGTQEQQFVYKLGFPEEYAGLAGRGRRDQKLVVQGPSALPDLHDFQTQIAENIQELLEGKNGNRGMLSLPTGAGKTRIAVEALTVAIREKDINGPILWVAQKDELCEQAVESWEEVWRDRGSNDELHISRLWAENEASKINDHPQVVVATDAKLNHCVPKQEYKWLSKAKCVVIDEAHVSTSKTYTKILKWLSLDRRKTGTPLLGLTATPFRGKNEKETKRLANRYGNHRLDHNAFDKDDPYAALQEMGVLARVEHQQLPGVDQMDMELSKKQMAQFEKTKLMPSAVEERVARDQARNRTLLDSISELDDDWPVLLFAASVDHAKTLAALLSMRDIKAASIDADTKPSVRRYYIDQFRRRKLRVLTNYGVLTQGFDAPAIRAVYVARPTFSPNVYQQMIGRGLRGPKNGGEETCLIVNILDTFKNFGERLAFYDFEPLWKR
jgi:superfamily II DNA or RNA helicase